MTIYSATAAWIPQARKTVRKFASGLQITEQEFIFPGTPADPPKNDGETLDESFVFPQPSISVNDAGISSSTVTAYGIWSKTSGPPDFFPVSVFEKIESKILKTGQAVTNTVDQETQTTTQSTQEFKYLAARVQTKIACSTNDLQAPSSPSASLLVGNNPDYCSIITEPAGFGFSLQKSWVLVAYEVQNFGQISEVAYTYEVEAIYSRTV
jgi:hypothetical protein